MGVKGKKLGVKAQGIPAGPNGMASGRLRIRKTLLNSVDLTADP